MNLLEEINEQDLVALRRHFHRYPEPSREEYRTAERIQAELDAMGIQNRRIDHTGVLGIIRGEGSGNRVIVLRADIDALHIQDEKAVPYCSSNPGIMHACGHDMHTAALLGAAGALQARRDAFGGEVRLFFQHGEEIGCGAKAFIKEGLLDGAERVFGIHAASDLPVGKIGVRAGGNNASVDHFRIVVQGKGAHVSMPHQGTDALYIASQIVVSLQAIVTRRVSPVDVALIGVGCLNSGTAYNVVAKEARLEGTTRTVKPGLRAFINDQISQITLQTAQLYGGTATVAWTDYASPLVNDQTACEEAGQVISKLWGRDSLVTDRALSMGGDDFAEYLLKVPGVYAYVGTGNQKLPNTVEPHHSSVFDIDETALPAAARLYAEYAYRWLNAFGA